jgi:prepilin peptidase CpaA
MPESAKEAAFAGSGEGGGARYYSPAGPRHCHKYERSSEFSGLPFAPIVESRVDEKCVGEHLSHALLAGAMALALIAGWTDLRSRRIPNWLTVPALFVGLAVNIVLSGLAGLKTSLLGAALGLILLLPFVLLRALGAGDWKLAGALGAFVGPGLLVDLLLASVFVAGVMALALVVYKGRVRQTAGNIGHILVSLVTFRLPGHAVTLDNPDALKVPYGVALAATVLIYGIGQAWRMT